MIIRQVPWSDVLPWSIVLMAGHPVIVLPSPHPDILALLHGGQRMSNHRRPDGFATVLEPEIGDALRNLMDHFTLEDVKWVD